MRFTTTSVHQPQGSKMEIQTILNRVEKQKGFVYSKASFNKKGELEIEVRPRRNSRAICSGCGEERIDLRSQLYPPISVCSALGYCGILGLRHAKSQLQGMWGNHRTSSLGMWQEPAHVLVPIVSGNLGQAFELEGDGRSFFDKLG